MELSPCTGLLFTLSLLLMLSHGYSQHNMEIEERESSLIGNMSCISHNHEDMNCSFCPDNYQPGGDIVYKINYTVFSREFNCTGNTPNCTCYWCGDDVNPWCKDKDESFYVDGNYDVYVSAWNTTASSEAEGAWFNFSANASIVKANPVRSLTVNDTGSRSMAGWFEPPRYTSHLVLIYWVCVICDNHLLDNQTICLGRDTAFTVEHLHPYTNYSVEVINRVNHSSYYSDPAVIDGFVITLAEAPASGPPMPFGAVRMGNPCMEDNCHQVHVFWELLHELSRNGPLSGYNVTVYGGGGDVVDQRDVYSEGVYSRDMYDDQSYSICVSAYNDVGNDTVYYSAPSCTERIPVLEMLPNAAVWAERLDNVIIMNIEAPADTNITVFSCEPVGGSLSQCKSPISSEMIPGVTGQHNVTHRNNTMYSVGVSTETAFSGMTSDWICFDAYYKRAGSVQGLDVKAEEERSLRVRWERTTCSTPNQHGRVVYYTIYWTCETGEAQNVTVLEDVSNHTIEALQPYSLCNVSMEAVARGGAGPRSAVVQALTAQSRPGLPPQNVQISNVTTHGFLVTFDPTPMANGIVTHYIVAVGDNLNETTGELRVEVKGLEGYRNYSVGVVAVNAAGSSPSSPLLQAQTLIGAPSMITSSSIAAIKLVEDPTTLSVNWSAPKPRNGPVTNYTVYVRGGDGQEAMETTRGDVLHAGVTYPCRRGREVQANVTVVAINVNEAGEELVSEEPVPRETTVCSTSSAAGRIAGIALSCLCLVILAIVVWQGNKIRKNKLEGDVPVFIPEDIQPPQGQDNPIYDSGYPARPPTINHTNDADHDDTTTILHDTSDSGRSGSLSCSPFASSRSGSSSSHVSPADSMTSNGYGSGTSEQSDQKQCDVLERPEVRVRVPDAGAAAAQIAEAIYDDICADVHEPGTDIADANGKGSLGDANLGDDSGDRMTQHGPGDSMTQHGPGDSMMQRGPGENTLEHGHDDRNRTDTLGDIESEEDAMSVKSPTHSDPVSDYSMMSMRSLVGTNKDNDDMLVTSPAHSDDPVSEYSSISVISPDNRACATSKEENEDDEETTSEISSSDTGSDESTISTVSQDNTSYGGSSERDSISSFAKIVPAEGMYKLQDYTLTVPPSSGNNMDTVF